MIIENLKPLREKYAYPPARLARVDSSAPFHLNESIGVTASCPTEEQWQDARHLYSSVDLDAHHHRLLNSQDDEDILVGVCSVTYWGYVSGANRRINQAYAWNRTKWVMSGNRRVAGNAPDLITEKVRVARGLLSEKEVGVALANLMELRFFGMAFASKILAFMDPERCGVYDRLISHSLKSSSDKLFGQLHVPTQYSTSLSMKRKQAHVYQQWCEACSALATDLNSSSTSSWVDWDGRTYPWRAIDVERAYFQSQW